MVGAGAVVVAAAWVVGAGDAARRGTAVVVVTAACGEHEGRGEGGGADGNEPTATGGRGQVHVISWGVGGQAGCRRVGIAASSSVVYGSCGRANTSATAPRSTICPSRITATSWAIWRTTARSWEMNR